MGFAGFRHQAAQFGEHFRVSGDFGGGVVRFQVLPFGFFKADDVHREVQQSPFEQIISRLPQRGEQANQKAS